MWSCAQGDVTNDRLPLLIWIPVRHSGGPLRLTLTLTLTPGMADLRNGGPPEWGGGGTLIWRLRRIVHSLKGKCVLPSAVSSYFIHIMHMPYMCDRTAVLFRPGFTKYFIFCLIFCCLWRWPSVGVPTKHLLSKIPHTMM